MPITFARKLADITDYPEITDHYRAAVASGFLWLCGFLGGSGGDGSIFSEVSARVEHRRGQLQ